MELSLAPLHLRSLRKLAINCGITSPLVQPCNLRTFLVFHSSYSRPVASARSGVARVASIASIFTFFFLATIAHCSANLLLSYRVSSQTLTDFRLSAGIFSHGIGFLGPKV